MVEVTITQTDRGFTATCRENVFEGIWRATPTAEGLTAGEAAHLLKAKIEKVFGCVHGCLNVNTVTPVTMALDNASRAIFSMHANKDAHGRAYAYASENAKKPGRRTVFETFEHARITALIKNQFVNIWRVPVGHDAEPVKVWSNYYQGPDPYFN